MYQGTEPQYNGIEQLTFLRGASPSSLYSPMSFLSNTSEIGKIRKVILERIAADVRKTIRG